MSNPIKETLKKHEYRPTAHYPIFNAITGSVVGGLLLSQIVYWHYIAEQKMDKHDFYKSDREFCEELYLGKYELETAKKKLKKLDLISTAFNGFPRKTFYKLNENNLLSAIDTFVPNKKKKIVRVKSLKTLRDEEKKFDNLSKEEKNAKFLEAFKNIPY